MVNEIRTIYARELNKGIGSMFRVSSRVRQDTPEEGWRTHRPKRCEYTNKIEDNSPNTLNNKSHQASSKKLNRYDY